MTIEVVELVIGKTIFDAEFRASLFANPEEALSCFKLTAAEKNYLKKVDRESLEFMANIFNRSWPVSKRGQKKSDIEKNTP